MLQHTFILEPGSWVGEGKIILSMIEEIFSFRIQWTVPERDASGKVQCIQEIQIQGLSENLRNELTFRDFNPKQFVVDMENQNIGCVAGNGVVDEQIIAWEFRNRDTNFEGYETYARQEDGSYAMKGEYVTADQLRSQIEAHIWPQRSLPHYEEEPGEPLE